MNHELENLRKAAIANRIMKYVVCYGIPLLIGILVGTSQDDFLTGAACFAFPCMFLTVLWSKLVKNRALAQYRAIFKKVMIESALCGGTLYEEMEFEYDAGITPKMVINSGLLSANRFYSDCYISGVSNGVKFVQADIRNVSSIQSTGTILEYDGTFIAFPTALPDATQTNIYHKDADISVILPGKEYKTGRADFDSNFKVRSSQPDSAKALITDDFMKQLLALQSRTERKIAMTVKQGWVYAFLPNKNSVLRPKLFAKYDASMNTAIIKELSLAQEFIQAFKRIEN